MCSLKCRMLTVMMRDSAGHVSATQGYQLPEKQIIEQCKYMLVQPDWVAAVVVQVKTQGGTELIANGTAAEAVEL